MKKYLAILLALVMLAICGICLAEDAEILTDGDYNYSILEDGTARIHQYDTFNDKTTVRIPEKLGGKQVTELGEWSFSGCTAATVVIPEGVKVIGEGAFAFCDALENITIPKSVTAIGTSAFEDCASLTSVTIPGAVEELSDQAFIGCSSLTSAVLGEGMTIIGTNALHACYALETINLPDSLQDIGACILDECDSVNVIVKENTLGEAVCESYGYSYTYAE